MNVLLVGYFGKQNVGDDAFVQVAARAARERLGAQKVYVTGKPNPFFRNEGLDTLYTGWTRKGAGFLDRLKTRSVIGKIDHIVFAGGSNFHSTSVNQFFESLVSRARGRIHLAAGISIGPYMDDRAERSTYELLNKLASVSVRDRASYQRALAMGLPERKVRLLPDIALQMNYKPAKKEVGAPFRVGVSLCNLKNVVSKAVDPRALVEAVAESLRSAFEAGTIGEAVFFDMNGGSEQGDHELHEAVIARLGRGAKVRHLGYEHGPDRVLGLVSGLDCVIAMRLHAAIFAYRARVPFVKLMYHEKCQEWCELAGWPKALSLDVAKFDAAALSHGLSLVVENRYGYDWSRQTTLVAESGKCWELPTGTDA